MLTQILIAQSNYCSIQSSHQQQNEQCRNGFLCSWTQFHLFCDFVFEGVGGFECRDVVRRDDKCGILAEVASGFLGTDLYDKGTEATEIYVLAVCEAIFYDNHELLYHRENGRLVDARRFSYLVNYIYFSHIVLNLISFPYTKLLKIGQILKELTSMIVYESI